MFLIYYYTGQIFFHDTSNPMSSRITAANSVEDYSYMGKVTLLQGVSFKWYRRLQLHG